MNVHINCFISKTLHIQGGPGIFCIIGKLETCLIAKGILPSTIYGIWEFKKVEVCMADAPDGNILSIP